MSATRPLLGSFVKEYCARPSRCFNATRPYLSSCRTYYTPSAAPVHSPYREAETAILTAATKHIPQHGFTQTTMAKGAQDAGYLPASLALLPRGVFELVMYHLVTQRLALKDNVPWAQPPAKDDSVYKGVGAKVRHAVLTRLHANAPFAHRYSEAIAQMSLASNIPPSLAELGRLADEIWWLAGDASVDTSWYTKRGLLSAVYAATETFMTQDQSTEFKDTERFLDRRLEDVRILGQGASDIGQYLGFAGISTVNVLRSWGVRV